MAGRRMDVLDIREMVRRFKLGESDRLQEFLHVAMRKIIDEALEAEVADVLGRGHYERRREVQGGYRNGHRPARVK